MIVETRKTAQGTEYWDAVEKRTRFVAKGNTPSFEVTTNPTSMLLGVDLASGQDTTAIYVNIADGKSNGTRLEDMTVPQLREFANEIDVEIPSDIKKKDDIIKHLVDAE
ncbi:hypothetical protein FQ087_06105 [Sporosarcina sp. ANT_H38]|uniref:hypothetical protein n=1 Tax=Sporosarcina sp. ANT_H38 TaxID=2597358 RepID=UPI0011F0C7E2|nr:hypothetical protein [Sporosarcina sp. ANT_H38]KAA0965837.1 hypothetical protein FQ087_06105 [Sporosarcina sp. ANT_H38]